MTAAAPGTLTRLTLVGPQRRADLVLPADAPLGELLPDIVRFLGFQPGQPPHAYQLSEFGGRVIPLDRSLRAAQVADGAVIRVDHVSDAPMTAVVHDVTDEVADDLRDRGGRWGEAPRRWLSTFVAVVGALLAALAAAPPVVAPPVLFGLGVLVLIAGAATALAGQRRIGTALVLGGAVVTAVPVPDWVGPGPGPWVVWLALAGVTTATALGVNGHQRAGLSGAAALLGLLALWVLFALVGLPPARIAALLAVASTVLLGLLPRFALISSGLTRLDDQQSADRPAARTSVRSAVDAAHRGLVLATISTAASIAVAAWVLAHSSTPWAVALAVLLAVTTLLRARACPLTAEVVALVVAVLVAVTGLVRHWLLVVPGHWWGAALVAVAVVLVALVAMAYEPPAHVRARGRQLADRVEGLAVIAMLPVVIGVFGLYTSLLNTF